MIHENSAPKLNSLHRDFLIAGGGWLLVALGFCWLLSSDRPLAFDAIRWAAAVWLLSMINIAAIAKLVGALTDIPGRDGEKRAAAIIRTLSWGLLKLACLGVFVFMFTKVASGGTIQGTTLGLFSGLGTLLVVPLVAGILWNSRVSQNV